MELSLLFGGIGCGIVASSLYFYGKDLVKVADQLRSVHRVDQLKDLAREELPSVVSVQGRVGSDTPIKGEYTGLIGVIVKQTTEHILQQNGKLIRIPALKTSKYNEVPWYIDDGTGRVHVVPEQSATDLVVTKGSIIFEKTARSVPTEGTNVCEGLTQSVESLPPVELLGIEKTELVLPIGARLTIVGEAIKDGTGSFCIQAPHEVT